MEQGLVLSGFPDSRPDDAIVKPAREPVDLSGNPSAMPVERVFSFLAGSFSEKVRGVRWCVSGRAVIGLFRIVGRLADLSNVGRSLFFYGFFCFICLFLSFLSF